VECISIRGSRIVDVGNLGTLYSLSWMTTSERRILAIVDMKPHYLRPISAVLPTWVVDSLGPRLVQVDERAVVVPGLAGKFAR